MEFSNNQILYSNNYLNTYCNNGLERLDEDKIIVCNNTNLIIILISKLKIIREINIDYIYLLLLLLLNELVIFYLNNYF